MNANKMTQKTLETLQQAQSLAEERRNTQVGQIHVFHALLDDPDDSHGLPPGAFRLSQAQGSENGSVYYTVHEPVHGYGH